ncbi:MAG: substrate-binding domain-containing protein [Anaerolineae bacterium]|nr:substrate-binding domain-containing protein [Anaerolineae bacterium]
MEADIATGKKSPTIGFFISRLRSYYEALWNGIAQVATEEGANVLCFIGAELDSQISFQRHWNVIYDLASPDTLDGMIVSAALQNYITPEEMSRFCARYAPLPVISIGSTLPGIASITIDNFVGLHTLIGHLIDDHQYRRIAFIQGPERNPEARIRYRAYTEALQEHDIPFDPDLVAPGNFTANAGVEAIRLLIDQRKVKFDAVVAGDDIMAIGVCQELARRGIDIPLDIAVTGFDDTPEARIIATPLTTVHQPLVEQGRQAAHMLLDYLRHGTPMDNLVLETQPVIRESCGCSIVADSTPRLSSLVVSADNLEDDFAQRRKALLMEVRKTICPYFADIAPENIAELVSAFFEELEGHSTDRFMLLFRHLLRKASINLSRTELNAGMIAKWQDVLSILRVKALLYKQPGATTKGEELLHQGHILITQIAERAHSNLRVQAEANILIQSEIVCDINAALDIRQIADALAHGLPRLGIRTCALALYTGEPIPSPYSRLIMACSDGQRLPLEPGGCLFLSRQLLPPGVLPDEKKPFMGVRPLVSQGRQIGFLLLEMIAGYRTMCDTYEELVEQISSALYKVLLLQQIRQANDDLQQRAAEMVEANIQLEQFAYITSHDLQEPLRIVAGYLGLLEARYRDRLDTDALEFIGYAIDGAKRMKRMIDDLLAYSRVTIGSQPLGSTDCEQILLQALSNLRVTIEENNAQITHDPLPVVIADTTQLTGIFQNLIGNAIKFNAGRRPEIHISAQHIGEEWVFSVRDNGIGIAPEYFERLFIIFSRLHTQNEYPGTGIGLAICKKVIERHGGRIWVESQPGQGATFFFSLPASQG